MTDYKKYLIDRSREFNDIEQPTPESYIQAKNRRSLEAYKAKRCGLGPDPVSKSWLRRILGL